MSLQGTDADDSDHGSEGDDTLGPLPDDVLVHPHDHVDEHSSPHPQNNGLSSSSSLQHSQGAAATNTAATSKRRSVDAGSKKWIFPARNATPQDLIHARKLVDTLQKEHGFAIPDRGNLDDPSILWKEGRPDYTIADLHYLLGKSKNHAPGSSEEFVENFIKTWEMEATHKEFYQWTTVDHYEYEVQANGGKVFSSDEAGWVGNYNWLLSSCRKDLYDSTNETFESSHGRFRYAFPEGFPFEVLEVFSGPPKVAFTWRHWAVFSGQYEGHQGSGETINMTGFGLITLNEDTKAKKIEIYYDPDRFLEVLRGKRECTDGVDQGAAFGEPIAGGMEALACMMASVEMEERELESGGADGGKPPEKKDNGKPGSRCPFSGASS